VGCTGRKRFSSVGSEWGVRENGSRGPLRRVLGAGLNSWDIAAGALLVREAGGFVTGADGEANHLETGSICCGNEIMHRELLGLLRGVA